MSNISLKQSVCKRCILDITDDPTIHFDENGICNYCHAYDLMYTRQVFTGPKADMMLKEKIEKIKNDGKGNKYDCIVGVSGGVDSTYVAYLAKKYELRPLLVHFDNGWNSEMAVMNIENIVQKLGFDLYTYVINWEEFKDLQLSFLKASVVDIEMITDHAISAALYHLAKKHNIRHTINGNNIVTEGVMPSHWVHKKNDWLNINDIHNKFGKVSLKSFPRTTFFSGLMNHLFFKIESFPVLNYVAYNKAEVKKLITSELGWKDYGGKHYESVFTRFYQAYILPVKFKIDKRKAHLSTLICSGQITRDQALEEMKLPIYDPLQLKEDKLFVAKKFGISEAEFDQLMTTPPKKHLDYESYIKKHWHYHEVFFNRISKIRRVLKLK